jgi:hypothetical protein
MVSVSRTRKEVALMIILFMGISSVAYSDSGKNGVFACGSYEGADYGGECTFVNGVKEGPFTDYPSNKTVRKGTFKSGRMDGPVIETGEGVENLITYSNGEYDGPHHKKWNGKIAQKGQFTKGKKTGVWEDYEEGVLISKTDFNSDGRVFFESYQRTKDSLGNLTDQTQLSEKGLFIDTKGEGNDNHFVKSGVWESCGISYETNQYQCEKTSHNFKPLNAKAKAEKAEIDKKNLKYIESMKREVAAQAKRDREAQIKKANKIEKCLRKANGDLEKQNICLRN